MTSFGSLPSRCLTHAVVEAMTSPVRVAALALLGRLVALAFQVDAAHLDSCVATMSEPTAVATGGGDDEQDALALALLQTSSIAIRRGATGAERRPGAGHATKLPDGAAAELDPLADTNADVPAASALASEHAGKREPERKSEGKAQRNAERISDKTTDRIKEQERARSEAEAAALVDEFGQKPVPILAAVEVRGGFEAMVRDALNGRGQRWFAHHSREEWNRFLAGAAGQGVPLIFGMLVFCIWINCAPRK